MDKELENYLKNHKISYKIHEHEAVFTVAESDKLKHEIPGVRTKSLFLKDEKNSNFYLVCLPGEKRLDIKALQSNLKTGKLKFASPEEMLSELKVSPGSASLFCMIHAKKTILILDKEVWDSEKGQFHPNINTATLEVTHENIKRFYDSLPNEKHILEL